MQNLIFILVSPAREENIGASARAMNTMGIKELFIVDPQADHLGNRAMATAFGSQGILRRAKIFDTFENAIFGIDLVIGTLAKKRNVAQTYHKVDELTNIISLKGDCINNAAIAFGSEENGLTNTQLSRCHLLSTIPMRRSFPSLNLAQSVMIYAYNLSKLTLLPPKRVHKNSPEAELTIIRNKAVQLLNDVGLLPEHLVYPRIMERLMAMEKDDINLFHSFCKFYLKKYHGRLK